MDIENRFIFSPSTVFEYSINPYHFSPPCKRVKYCALIRNADRSSDPVPFIPDVIDGSQIVKKFKLLERHAVGKMRLRLAVFCFEDDDQLCYEYSKIGKNVYRCVKCVNKKVCVRAKLISNGAETFVKMSTVKHICEPEPYQEPHARQIHPPNFKIDCIKNPDGHVTKELTVFDPHDSSRSFVYFFISIQSVFECSDCKKMNKVVTAKLHQNETDGTSYLELSKTKHICESKPNRKILKDDDFQLQRDADGKFINLFVFHPEIGGSCYSFFPIKQNRFRCRGCFTQSKKCSHEAKLFQHDSGEYYIKMGNFQHICEPIITSGSNE